MYKSAQNTCEVPFPIGCFATCQVCTGAKESNCNECIPGYFLYSAGTAGNQCVTVCPAGSYPDGLICSLCRLTCGVCTGSNDCQKCATGYMMSSSVPGLCGKTCQSGEIPDSTDLKCYPPPLYPSGAIDYNVATRLSLSYTVGLAKGMGTITLLKAVQGKDPVVVFSVTSDSSTVVLRDGVLTVAVAAGTLDYGQQYGVKVTAGTLKSANGFSMSDISTSLWSFTVNPYKLLPLVAVLNGGVLSVETKSDGIISLDGSASFDPSDAFRKTFLTFSWSCFDISQSYQVYKAQPLSSWGGFVIASLSRTDLFTTPCLFWDSTQQLNATAWNMRDASFRIDQVFGVVFGMADQEGRSASATIYIRIISPLSSSIQFANAPKTRININKPFKLSPAPTTVSSTASPSLTWSYTSSVSSTLHFLTPVTGSWYLTVGEGSMVADAVYTFTLTYTDSATSSSAVIQISTNAPPSGGNLVVRFT